MNKSNKPLDYSLYLVTDRNIIGGRSTKECVIEAVKGGATIVQLREKDLSTLEFYNEANELMNVLNKNDIPLIINDRLDIALAVKADGLHIGQEDMPVKIARNLIGNNMVLGVSVSTVEEALVAEMGGADYLGVGAMFPTSTKSDALAVSIEELENIKKAVKIPVVAIGGISLSNAEALLNTGIDGLSIISAILGKEDVFAAAKEFSELIKKYKK